MTPEDFFWRNRRNKEGKFLDFTVYTEEDENGKKQNYSNVNVYKIQIVWNWNIFQFWESQLRKTEDYWWTRMESKKAAESGGGDCVQWKKTVIWKIKLGMKAGGAEMIMLRFWLCIFQSKNGNRFCAKIHSVFHPERRGSPPRLRTSLAIKIILVSFFVFDLICFYVFRCLSFLRGNKHIYQPWMGWNGIDEKR